jgi:hypothetical protein
LEPARRKEGVVETKTEPTKIHLPVSSLKSGDDDIVYTTYESPWTGHTGIQRTKIIVVFKVTPG